jgi:hypothetical protein
MSVVPTALVFTRALRPPVETGRDRNVVATRLSTFRFVHTFFSWWNGFWHWQKPTGESRWLEEYRRYRGLWLSF